MAKRKSAEPPGKVPNMADENYVIPPCDETKAIPKGATCQEAVPFGGLILPCSQPAVAIVRHEKDGRAYYFCLPCADHNVRNRGGVLVKTKRGVKLTVERIDGKAVTLRGADMAPVNVGGTPPPMLPTMPGVVDISTKKSEPDVLMQFEDVVLIAQLEGVPLLNFVTQALQLIDQGKQITKALDGEKDKEGNTVGGGGLRPAINDFLANSGAPGFVVANALNDGRVFSFRRVETTRETLDAVLLLQNGVAADVIERSKRRSTTTALTIREIKGQ